MKQIIIQMLVEKILFNIGYKNSATLRVALFKFIIFYLSNMVC